MYEIRMCETIVDYYRDKIYSAKLRSLNLINLQMQQLQKNIVDVKVFQEIITLDELIVTYEAKIKEYQFRRNKFIKYKEANQAKNLRNSLNEYSRVQQDILNSVRNETNSRTNVPINRNSMFKLPSSFAKNIGSFRLTTSNQENRSSKNS